VTVREVLFRRKQEIDHELDHLTRSEMFACLLIGLFSADPNQFLKDIAHLHGIDVLRREVYGSESFDNEVEQILFCHPRDLHAKIETLHNRANIGGKSVDVVTETCCDLSCPCVVENPIQPATFLRFA
jgi:hypothetical protein